MIPVVFLGGAGGFPRLRLWMLPKLCAASARSCARCSRAPCPNRGDDRPGRPQQLLDSPWLIAALVLAVVGAGLLLAAIAALITLSPIKFITHAGLAGLHRLRGRRGGRRRRDIGYQPLAREELAARLHGAAAVPAREFRSASPTAAAGPSSWRATNLRGRAHPQMASVGHLLGLRASTASPGRYREMEKERFAPRTSSARRRGAA